MNQHKRFLRSYSIFVLGIGVLLCLLPACQLFKDKDTSPSAETNNRKETASTRTRSGTQEVHALLILLGNDRRIRDTVNTSESQMLLALTRVSKYCKKVNLTIMKSEDETRGNITQQTLQNGKTVETDNGTQGSIITSYQVEDWLQNLTPKSEDTVLIYYNGHGRLSGFDRHILQFDPEITGDILDRSTLSEELEKKPARLRMLITDTCSESIDSKENEFSELAVSVRERKHYYLDDLFLVHQGFLDITAASPKQVAIGNSELGGHLTYALFARACTLVSDANADNFISWQEAFKTTVSETKKLFRQASSELVSLDGQKTQEPVAYSLPTRIDDSDSVPPQPPDPIASTAILNFTSVPSGAEVEINGFDVGKTPLNGYELETDGRSTKEIEVTIKAEGYEDFVKKFQVQRGKPVSNNFELTKKETEIPKTIIAKEGAEEGLTKEEEALIKQQEELELLKVELAESEAIRDKLEADRNKREAEIVDMELIPAGEFQMGRKYGGSSNEKPVHTVHVDAFYMDIHEVTNAQYKKFVDANPQWRKDHIADRFHDGRYLKHWNGNNYPSGKADHPVVYVSWYAAMAYSQWVDKRLPTEAEWEKAARGGLQGKNYPWGNSRDSSKANYTAVGDTTPVRSYPPNGYGLYDMSGNVYEWCLDESKDNFYRVSPSRNPFSGSSITGTMNNFKNVKSSRILRGGSWAGGDLFARVDRRGGKPPTYSDIYQGFRCVRTVSP